MCPPEAARLRLTRTAIVDFIIDIKGRVTNVKAIDATSPLFAEEAVRVVRHSPRWTPGVADTGEAVRVKYTLPVNFKLR